MKKLFFVLKKIEEKNAFSFFALVLAFYMVYLFINCFVVFNLGNYTILLLFFLFALGVCLKYVFHLEEIESGGRLKSLSFSSLLGMSNIIVFSSLINHNFDMHIMITSVFFLFVFSSTFFFDFDEKDKKRGNLFLVITFSFLLFLYLFFNFFVDLERTPENVNSVYYLLFFAPFLIKVKNKAIVIIFLLALSLCVLISEKRTTFLALLVFLVIYVFMSSKKNTKQKTIILLASIFFTGLFAFLLNLLFPLGILERLFSVFEDSGSGRLDIYLGVLGSLKTNTFFDWIFGHGFEGVFLYSGVGASAHDDFLEILFNFGLIGLSFYLLFQYSIIKTFIDIKGSKALSSPLLASFGLFFVVSLFSNLLMIPSYFLLLCFFWGDSLKRRKVEIL